MYKNMGATGTTRSDKWDKLEWNQVRSIRLDLRGRIGTVTDGVLVPEFETGLGSETGRDGGGRLGKSLRRAVLEKY